MTQLLLVFATIQIIMSFSSSVPYHWLDSVTVGFAVLFAALMSSICDYGK